jgi:hypothetical protein
MGGSRTVANKDGCYRLSRMIAIITCLLSIVILILIYLFVGTERDATGERSPAIQSPRADVHLYFVLCLLSLLVGAIGAWRQKYACLFTSGVNLILLAFMSLAIDHSYWESSYMAALGLYLLVFGKYKNKGGCCIVSTGRPNIWPDYHVKQHLIYHLQKSLDTTHHTKDIDTNMNRHVKRMCSQIPCTFQHCPIRQPQQQQKPMIVSTFHHEFIFTSSHIEFCSFLQLIKRNIKWKRKERQWFM